MKITALEESADFATLDTKKLFSKLKSYELFRKGHPNHDASFSSKALIIGARVSGHVANPTNTTNSSVLEFALSSFCAASDEQYENIPDDEIDLLVRKFQALHRFRKERRRSPKCCFKCDDTTHFIADCTKRKKLDSSSNKYNYNNRIDSSDKGEGKKKYRFGDKKKRRSSRRWCPERVQPSATSTSPATTPPAPRRMSGPSARHATSSAFASWASHRDTSLTLTLMLVMTHPPRVFLHKSPNLKMLFATKTSCLVRFFVRTKS
jgi:hypothetical protein